MEIILMHAELEKLIEQHGLSDVLMAMAYICYGKARIIRSTYENNKRLATVWDFAGSCCKTAATKKSVLHVSEV